MTPIKMSVSLDDSIVHLDQIAATLEIVLAHVFESDSVDPDGTEAEVAAALEVCRQYPAWRAVLSHVWESLVTERDELAALAMRSIGKGYCVTAHMAVHLGPAAFAIFWAGYRAALHNGRNPHRPTMTCKYSLDCFSCPLADCVVELERAECTNPI